MKYKFTLKERQDIAYRIKWKCRGCPEEVTYHDIKNNLNSDINLLSFLKNESNMQFLFESKVLDEDLVRTLKEMTDITDLYFWRRIALFHGLIQFRRSHPIIDPKLIENKIDEIEFKNERNGLVQIFLNALRDVCSTDDETKIKARIALKNISEDREEGYENDSLFSHYMQLQKLSDIDKKAPDFGSNFDATSIKKQIPEMKAYEILFDFDQYDFQDYEFVGGWREIGKTKPMDRSKKNILKAIQDLNSLNLIQSIEYLS